MTDALCKRLKSIFFIYHRKNALTSANTYTAHEHILWQVLFNDLKHHTFIALLLGKGGYNSAAVNTSIHVLLEVLQLLSSSEERSKGELGELLINCIY